MIPLYACIAGTGRIYSLDDQTVLKDTCALNGSGGTKYAPYFISTPLGIVFDLGYSRARRFMQRIKHDGEVTMLVTIVRDGRESGVPITRALGVGDAPLATAPLGDTGSDFQIRVDLSDFTAPVALGNSEVYVLRKRGSR